MNIGGFQKTSLLDYPDRISAIVWTSGCNFRCPFCYNKSLALGTAELFPQDEILSFLSKRKTLLDGVVISGGEPFLQDDLVDFVKKIRDLRLLVKIDTNGSFPERLAELLEQQLVDYVAMDVKAPQKKYQQLTGTKLDVNKIDASIELLKTKAPAYEFKTTVIPGLLTKGDIIDIAQWLNGAETYFLQQFKIKAPLVSSALETTIPYSREYLLETLEEIKPFFKHCALRGV
ncbi:MAG TPA: anaerobic ribonucleoside-triphosphate reductase activating protein [Thermoplasmata archaeon]|jgi:pyruvate formate lyase activating enzyme|nr:anaerobic ribonucleoside-triphosphate reductase activating protein [Thermoplasmata archaeon]HIH29666.1 anaerobic ribonucleoside-triphosphate reductase activating protein [Thermoplasmata archaeon]